LHAAKSLECFDVGVHAPRRRELGELLLETREALDLLIDGADVLLEDDLLRGGRADDLGEVAAVRFVPVRTSAIDEAETKKKRLQAKLGVLERDACGVARATDVADRLVLDRGHVTRT